jgi:hypothetical protein
VLDGAAFPWDPVRAFKLGEVSRFHCDLGLYTAAFWFGMNDRKYRSLPEDIRKVIDQASGQALLAVCWSVLAALFLLLVAWHVGRAASQVLEYGESSATLAVPMIWYWVPILFGTVLAAIVCIQQLLRPISHSDHPQSP